MLIYDSVYITMLNLCAMLCLYGDAVFCNYVLSCVASFVL